MSIVDKSCLMIKKQVNYSLFKVFRYSLTIFFIRLKSAFILVRSLLNFIYRTWAIGKLDLDLDFIIFALFTNCLHWNFNLYKYLAEQSQK